MASYIVVSEVLLKWFSYVVKQHKQKNTFVFHLLDGKRSGPGETKNTIAVRQWCFTASLWDWLFFVDRWTLICRMLRMSKSHKCRPLVWNFVSAASIENGNLWLHGGKNSICSPAVYLNLCLLKFIEPVKLDLGSVNEITQQLPFFKTEWFVFQLNQVFPVLHYLSRPCTPQILWDTSKHPVYLQFVFEDSLPLTRNKKKKIYFPLVPSVFSVLLRPVHTDGVVSFSF